MKSVGGIHRTRLAASKVHRHLVKEARRAVQKLGWQVPEDDISPTVVGAIPLPFPVPDSFEAAFGYQGKSTVRTVRVHSRLPSIWVQRWRRRFAVGREPVVLVSSPPSGSPVPARKPISHPVWEVPHRKRTAPP